MAIVLCNHAKISPVISIVCLAFYAHVSFREQCYALSIQNGNLHTARVEVNVPFHSVASGGKKTSNTLRNCYNINFVAIQCTKQMLQSVLLIITVGLYSVFCKLLYTAKTNWLF